YVLAATWPTRTDAATTADFELLEGGRVVAVIRVNQREQPNDFSDDGNAWESLGIFRVATDRLEVRLGSSPTGAVVADAIRIQEVVGDRGIDDDFHLQFSSPAIDRGDPADDVSLEPVPNGGRINLGAFGGTIEATSSRAQVVQATVPVGYERYRTEEQVTIEWRSNGIDGGANAQPSFSIFVSADDGQTWQKIAEHLQEATPGKGRYEWLLPADVATGAAYRVRVLSEDTGAEGVSDRPFAIVPSTPEFYVNDADTTGDEFTTAPGDNRNTGKSPDQPMASIRALFSAYDLGPGDVVFIDTGVYPQRRSLVISSSDAGVTLQGALEHETRLDRGNLGEPVIVLQDADDTHLSHLTVAGGSVGVLAEKGSDSDKVAITANRFSDNRVAVRVFEGNDGWSIAENVLVGLPGSGQEDGIMVDAEGAAIWNNALFDFRTAVTSGPRGRVEGNAIYNSTTGIVLADGAVASENRIVGSTETGIVGDLNTVIDSNEIVGAVAPGGTPVGTGIAVNGALAVGNTVRSAEVGIDVRSFIGYYSRSGEARDNDVYGNTVGMRVQGRATGNRVFDNSVGVDVPGAISNFLIPATPHVTQNIVYDNATVGIRLETNSYGAEIANNTIYQPQGDGVTVTGFSSGVEIKNNIISVFNGYGLRVGKEAQMGVGSDYNLIDTHASGQVGWWQGVEFSELRRWHWGTGQDAHSLAADSQFVMPAGGDGILGFDGTSLGGVRTIDDSDDGFELTGDWNQESDSGLGNDYVWHDAGDGTAKARWRFESLEPGYYRVAVHYPALSTSSPIAPFAVYDGETLQYRLRVDQRVPPNDFQAEGVGWRLLGTFQISGGNLTVELDNRIPDGRAVADAVRIERVVGWG
ncbi:MAG TPA: hypothetical protein ENJ16_02380, partial [Planctomycetaceae bacterium]|nr:hypothetical protein [Planctomycetaceae bacterium]